MPKDGVNWGLGHDFAEEVRLFKWITNEKSMESCISKFYSVLINLQIISEVSFKNSIYTYILEALNLRIYL